MGFYQVHENNAKIQQLRTLSAMDCLLVSDPHLMRGVDYRRKGYGIDLLLAREFTTTRALHQGLGRVGRYAEPGERYQLASMTGGLVNKEEERRLAGQIGAKVNADKKAQKDAKAAAKSTRSTRMS